MSTNRFSSIVRWSNEDGFFVANCPEFPGIASHGETRESAQTNLEEALSLAIEVEEEDGTELPQANVYPELSGKFMVRMPVSLHRSLKDTADLEGVSLNQYVVSLLSRRDAEERMRIHSNKLTTELVEFFVQNETISQQAIVNPISPTLTTTWDC